MRRLRRLTLLSVAERRLLAEALLLVTLVRLGLCLLPFRTLQRLLKRVSPSPAIPGRGSVDSDTVAWAIQAAARVVPRATCLTQALAAQSVLRRYGHTASLRLGVARDPDGNLAAHAWVESAGRIVIGGAGRERYTALPTWNA